VALRGRHGPIEPVAQQQAVGQASEDIVLCEVGHSQRQRPGRAHVAKHDHRPDHPPLPVMNGRGGIFDRRLAAVAAQQQTVLGHAGVCVTTHRKHQRIPDPLAALGVDDPHDFLRRPADRLRHRPASHALGDRVQIGDIARQVRAENSVPDRIERCQRIIERHPIGIGAIGACRGLRPHAGHRDSSSDLHL